MDRSRGSILVVDDDQAVAVVLGALLGQAGYAWVHAPTGERGLAALESRPFDVVLTDLKMPGMDGLELLRRVAAGWPETPVVMLTAHGSIPIAVEAMRAGAADFVTKPFDREELLFTIDKAVTAGRHQEERGTTRPPASGEAPTPTSAAMRAVYDMAAKAARGTTTVLIRGESGTGKEVLARFVHESSPRKSAPLVKLHCAALPDTLLESELFGYEKGAFTGAVARKPGRVELADRGTLFLDEIGDVAPHVQVKLLRLLQEREFERLGSTETLKVDVRFVAATHRDLEGMVKRGEFREDLFYRLNVVPIHIPPLRERPEDVEPLALRFCADLSGSAGRAGVTIAKDALALLAAQPWPGNVRQLQNFVERVVVLSDGPVVTTADVERELGWKPVLAVPAGGAGAVVGAGAAPGEARAPAGASSAGGGEPGTLGERRKEAEREALLEALRRANDNRTLAARLLGVSRRTLYNKLAEHGM